LNKITNIPFSVKILSLEMMGCGIFLLVGSCLSGYPAVQLILRYLEKRDHYSVVCQNILNDLGKLSAVVFLSALAFSIIFFVISVGLWRGKRWAWFNVLVFNISAILILPTHVDSFTFSVGLLFLIAPLASLESRTLFRLDELGLAKSVNYFLILLLIYCGLYISFNHLGLEIDQVASLLENSKCKSSTE
jgi:uncharacterized membrane protein (DUF2068 family)